MCQPDLTGIRGLVDDEQNVNRPNRRYVLVTIDTMSVTKGTTDRLDGQMSFTTAIGSH